MQQQHKIVPNLGTQKKTLSDLIGISFIDGGRSITEGFDCWGLAAEVFSRYGLKLPDYHISAHDYQLIDAEMASQRNNWQEVNEPLPVPCLVVLRLECFGFANHAGVYIGNGKFIHAYRKTGVCIEKLNSWYWKTKIVGFYLPPKGCEEHD